MKIWNAMKQLALIAVACCALKTSTFAKEIIILVSKVPNVKSTEDIYVAANINDWDPFNENYRLKRVKNQFYLNISTKEEYLQLKFTRGSWDTVEGDELGYRIDNRLLPMKEIVDTIELEIRGWEDIKPNGAIRLQIVDVSYGSMHNDNLYVTGNFNGWNPGEENYQLQYLSENTYEIEIPYSGDILEYKYTRGSWNTVEGNDVGKIRNNRILVPPYQQVQVDTISTWEDLGTNRRYHLILERLPDNTPKDATIYVTGNFNEWNPGDDQFEMIELDGGKYHINIESELDTIIYKFTRGDFNTVEGRFNGLARPNRITVFGNQDFPVAVEIKTWEDLSGDWFNIYAISLIVPILLGILLVLALGGLKNSQPANSVLRILLLILCVSLILRLIPFYKEVFTTIPQMILLSDLVYFLFPVVSYIYIRRFFSGENDLKQLLSVLHFLPVSILAIAYLPFFLIDRDVFMNEIINQKYIWVFEYVGLLGLLFSGIYWYLSIGIQRKYIQLLEENLSYDLSLRYTRSIIFLGGIILLFWLSIYLIGWLSHYLGIDLVHVVEAITDVTWIVFSAYIYLFAFFAIQKPALFQVQVIEIANKSILVDRSEINQLKEKLDILMRDEKPYLDDQLSLSQLAMHLNITEHTLSKVINEGYDVNFYELINHYRVDEFIRLASDPKNEHKTFMGLAYEVGFNSKSTFNRSFKKEKGFTPREYFKQMKASV